MPTRTVTPVDDGAAAPAWTEPERAARLQKVANAIGPPFADAVAGAIARPGSDEAARGWQRVVDEARKVPDDLDAADLACVGCVALIQHERESPGGSIPEARSLFDTGRVFAAGGGNRDASLELAVAYATCLLQHGDVVEALEISRDAFRAAEGSEDARILEDLRITYAELLAVTGRARELLRVTDPDAARGTPSARALGDLTLHRGYALLLAGKLAEADTLLARAATTLEELGQTALAARARTLRLLCVALTGDPTLTRATLDAHEDAGPDDTAPSEIARFEAWLVLGETERVLSATRKAEALAPDTGAIRRAWQESYRARALLAKGQHDAALRCARQAIDVSRSRDLSFPLVRSRGVAALALLRTQGPAAKNAVLDEFADADECLERTGCKTLDPALEEWRAELVTVLGDPHAGDHRRREAARLYTRIGAAGHARRLSEEPKRA